MWFYFLNCRSLFFAFSALFLFCSSRSLDLSIVSIFCFILYSLFQYVFDVFRCVNVNACSSSLHWSAHSFEICHNFSRQQSRCAQWLDFLRNIHCERVRMKMRENNTLIVIVHRFETDIIEGNWIDRKSTRQTCSQHDTFHHLVWPYMRIRKFRRFYKNFYSGGAFSSHYFSSRLLFDTIFFPLNIQFRAPNIIWKFSTAICIPYDSLHHLNILMALVVK